MKKVMKITTIALLAAGLVGCSSSSSNSDKVITVGATAVPHAEILNDVVAGVLAEEGWTLKVTEFTDYVTPNTALEEGSLDANYFQTLGYMNEQNNSAGVHLAAVAGVHIEPMGIYSKTLTSLDEIADGSTISLPNDTDNLDRALRVLVQAGLLEDPGTDDYVSETDFNGNATLNPRGFVIQPVEAAQVPLTIEDVDFAVINGNYALEAGLPSTYPAFYVEEFDTESTIARTNYLVVKQGDEETEKTKALIAAITSEEVATYIDNTYKGSVITSFIDAEGNSLVD